MRPLIGSFASLGLLALVLLPSPVFSGCDSIEEPVTCTNTDAYEVVDTTPSGVTPGAEVVAGQCIAVRYEGRRKTDGFVFDSGTFNFRAGTTAVIGFNQSVIESPLHDLPAQRVGESRRVTIPPSLGYGAQDRSADLPACTTMEFDVTVLDILSASAC